ncbi:MAG: hypothetical protein LBG87_00335 [Spirochaetaceae bacterium]|jgi:hypothetical protein|nr:hypothetical protein [Spirochaetaceae bacterium]
MKAKKTLFGFAALFLAAVFSLTCLACKNEEEGDSGGDSGASKPAELSSSATYNDAVAKCNAIIAYCDAHPGDTNDSVKSSVQTYKNPTLSSYQSTWASMKTAAIAQINLYIGQLE